MTQTPSFGEQLKSWRTRRRMSQMDLALDAEISTRHLSFVETGRARPSREMVLLLAEQLEVPARDRNLLLVAAGFAPTYQERALDDPALAAARAAIDLLLQSQDPYPAFAVDRHWNVLSANRAMTALLAGGAGELPTGSMNALKIGLDPNGVGANIVNYREWRGHILERLKRQIHVSGDAVLAELYEELAAYPEPPRSSDARPSPDLAGILVPFQLATPAGVLSFLSTTTVFGTPVDITLAEIAIESFFPADAATAAIMRGLVDGAT